MDFTKILNFSALDEGDITILKRYGQGPYAEQLKNLETDIEGCLKRVNELCGVKESDTGLAPPALWDIAADKQAMQSEQPLQVRDFVLDSEFRVVIRLLGSIGIFSLSE